MVQSQAFAPQPIQAPSPQVSNRILLALPQKERTRLLEKMQYASIPAQTVLLESGSPIDSAYFVESGLCSFLNIMQDGKTVEVGMCGNEGFIGTPALVGYRTNPFKIVSQISGTVFRIAIKDLEEELKVCPTLAIYLHRNEQDMALQSQQVLACNALHEIHKRLARWLLMSQDRVRGDVIHLTQQSLAYMLATRRASVTIAAGILQKAGVIQYRRGAIKIEDRKGLEKASCECYSALTQQISKWQNELK